MVGAGREETHQLSDTRVASCCPSLWWHLHWGHTCDLTTLERQNTVVGSFGPPVSPASALIPAIDSRQAVREEDSFQCSHDEYISPRWQLLQLYSLYNRQYDLTTLPSCICFSAIDRIGQRPRPLLQRFRGPSS